MIRPNLHHHCHLWFCLWNRNMMRVMKWSGRKVKYFCNLSKSQCMHSKAFVWVVALTLKWRFDCFHSLIPVVYMFSGWIIVTLDWMNLISFTYLSLVELFIFSCSGYSLSVCLLPLRWGTMKTWITGCGKVTESIDNFTGKPHPHKNYEKRELQAGIGKWDIVSEDMLCWQFLLFLLTGAHFA